MSGIGGAGFETTVSARGEVGSCTTTWTLNFNTIGYVSESPSFSRDDIRSDNATSGLNPTIGCVVPWYPPEVIYSYASHPTLASHVDRAQESGLPGATLERPLHLNNDPQAIELNRHLACGNAPSIQGLSCDEYPLASTMEGLHTNGGTLRSFDGCQIDAPQEEGPVGVSACMINASDNRAQGRAALSLLRSRTPLEWRSLPSNGHRIAAVVRGEILPPTAHDGALENLWHGSQCG